MYLLIVSTWKKYESISWSNVHPVKFFDYFVFDYYQILRWEIHKHGGMFESRRLDTISE